MSYMDIITSNNGHIGHTNIILCHGHYHKYLPSNLYMDGCLLIPPRFSTYINLLSFNSLIARTTCVWVTPDISSIWLWVIVTRFLGFSPLSLMNLVNIAIYTARVCGDNCLYWLHIIVCLGRTTNPPLIFWFLLSDILHIAPPTCEVCGRPRRGTGWHPTATHNI